MRPVRLTIVSIRARLFPHDHIQIAVLKPLALPTEVVTQSPQDQRFAKFAYDIKFH